MGAVGPYFAVRVGGPADGPPAGHLPLSDLYAAPPDGPLGGRIAAAAQRLRTREPRVAASVLHLGLAARLWSVALGAAVLGGQVPDLDPAHAHYHWPATGPLDLWLPVTTTPPSTPLHPAHPSPDHAAPPADDGQLASAVHRSVVERNLRPLHAAVRAVAPVAERLLWGNAASALAGALTILHTRLSSEDPAAAATALRVTRALLASTPLLDTGTLTAGRPHPGPAAPPRFRRTSCCLYYRLPGGGTCGDCVFGTRPPRHRPTPPPPLRLAP